jgi:uncharacterized membrane protein
MAVAGPPWLTVCSARVVIRPLCLEAGRHAKSEQFFGRSPHRQIQHRCHHANREDFLKQRSIGDRISEVVSNLAGSIGFVIVHAVVFSAWIVINLGLIPGLPVFDRFPFGLLSLIVGLEAIFLSTFVLMTQNRQSHQADHWAHLDLQISLLAEQEIAKILQLSRAVCRRLGIENQIQDRDLQEMIEKKSVGELAEKLAEDLERTRQEEQAPGREKST